MTQEHACKPPGELVYAAPEAQEGDEERSLCACGKKCLSFSKGQHFMCVWTEWAANTRHFYS